MRIWDYWYFFWQSWFQLVLHPAPGFHIMYSAYKLNKQGDNIQPCCTPFLIWNQSIVICPVIAVASWPAYRFLRRQVRWSGIPISLRISHSLCCSTQSKALAFLFFFFCLSCLFFISWRLITLQYCSGFCHTLTWIGCGWNTCISKALAFQ